MRQLELTLNTIKVTFELEALDTGQMPHYSASIFRGMIGKELFEKACEKDTKDCENCNLISECAYATVFEPYSKVFAPHLQSKMKYLPPPFILEAPFFLNGQWVRGEKKELTIILLGDSVNTFFEITEAMIRVATIGVGKDRITFQINRITQEYQSNFNQSLFNEDYFRIDDVDIELRKWNQPDKSVSSLLINIETPLRLVSSGVLITKLTAAHFLLTVLRRCEYVTDLYGSGFSPHDKEQLIHEVIPNIRMESYQLEWIDWQRYSARKQKEMKLGGLVGSFILCGDLVRVLPYLLCASHVHIGKQTVFGLGKFSVYQKLS